MYQPHIMKYNESEKYKASMIDEVREGL